MILVVTKHLGSSTTLANCKKQEVQPQGDFFSYRDGFTVRLVAWPQNQMSGKPAIGNSTTPNPNPVVGGVTSRPSIGEKISTKCSRNPLIGFRLSAQSSYR